MMASWMNKPDRCHDGRPSLIPAQLHSGGGDGEQTGQWRELQGFMQCYLIDKIYIDLSVENNCKMVCLQLIIVEHKLYILE